MPRRHPFLPGQRVELTRATRIPRLPIGHGGWVRLLDNDLTVVQFDGVAEVTRMVLLEDAPGLAVVTDVVRHEPAFDVLSPEPASPSEDAEIVA